jgi:ribose 5-phosphate isomerase A
MAEDQHAAERQRAAEQAAQEVHDGMVIGFGTGRSANHALEVLARRAREEGLRVCGAPSSLATEAHARRLGLALVSLDDHPRLDLTIDGADEVDPQGRIVKGGGGAHLREKVLAAASDRLLIVVDSTKLVPYVGATRGVPLEVLPFAAGACAAHLRAMGGSPALRYAGSAVSAAGGSPPPPFVTNNGNWVIDCTFPRDALADAESLDARLHAIPGILETGLFLGLRPTVYVGTAYGPKAPAGVWVWQAS